MIKNIAIVYERENPKMMDWHLIPTASEVFFTDCMKGIDSKYIQNECKNLNISLKSVHFVTADTTVADKYCAEYNTRKNRVMINNKTILEEHLKVLQNAAKKDCSGEDLKAITEAMIMVLNLLG